MNLKEKTILITGIGGFVGSRTAELALEQGMIVKGLQRTHAWLQNTDLQQLVRGVK